MVRALTDCAVQRENGEPVDVSGKLMLHVGTRRSPHHFWGMKSAHAIGGSLLAVHGELARARRVAAALNSASDQELIEAYIRELSAEAARPAPQPFAGIMDNPVPHETDRPAAG